MMFEEEAKAVQEVAKTGQESLKTAQMFGSFISRIIGGSLEQGVGIFEDKLKYMRKERSARLEYSYRKLEKELGLNEPDKIIPMKYAVPLFQAATLEDDDYLQDLWINLLVKASHKEFNFDINRTYIDILERLSPFEADILFKIYALDYNESKDGIDTTELPEKALVYKELMEDENQNINYASKSGEIELTEIRLLTLPPESDSNNSICEKVALALGNLDRLGCISSGLTMGPTRNFSVVAPTVLGKKLIESCSPISISDLKNK